MPCLAFSAKPTFDEEEVAVAAQIAIKSRSVVALLGQVPNQPLLFADESFALREDAFVAYTWDKAMRTGDWTWPAYLPMVKSAVRAKHRSLADRSKWQYSKYCNQPVKLVQQYSLRRRTPTYLLAAGKRTALGGDRSNTGHSQALAGHQSSGP